MKTKTKWLSIALTLCLIVSSLLVMVSAAGESTLAAEATREGIQAQLTTPKDTYAEKEAIDVTLNIGNNSGNAVANVVTTITTPDNLSVARGDLSKTYEELRVAQLLQNKAVVSLGELDDGPPKMGTGSLMTVSLVLMFASAAGLLLMVATGHIKLNKTFCLLLLVGVMLVTLIPGVKAAETDENKLEVAKEISVDGQTVTLKATVTWEEAKAVEITRGMAEEALVEYLWAFYAKGEWAQYNSTGGAGAMPYTHGGYSPLGKHFNTLEDATSQTHLFTVCSNYAWLAYWNTMGLPIYGDPLNAGSEFMWAYTDTSVAKGDVDDFCVMRWHNYACDSSDHAHQYVQHEDCISSGPLSGPDANGNYVIDIEPLKQWFANWEENLRPGDIIRLPGHIITYAGNGWILDAAGNQYKETFGGYDSWEFDGVINATTVEDYFLPTGLGSRLGYYLDKYAEGAYANPDTKEAGVCVLRPLDNMFIDDGDGDLTNDLLNTEYYHPGVDKLNWQLEELDALELPHTGYTVQASALTRVQYPMMNINRTVSVGVYGYAAKGETFTYSIEIINQSNNEKYITTQEDGYTGEKFVGVPVVEFLPEGVELVETNATAVIGNTLYWTVDVEAGESFDAYYTVRAVADMGYEIVNDGGWVGAIPSNQLVTTIGGKHLTEESVSKFIELYEAGLASWNSNGGYKISANVAQDATILAEQIYKIAGIDLDLPEMQELIKKLFDQEYIEIASGLYGQHKKSRASWQYTLVDATENAEDQVWHDMIMNGGFIGGTYLWTNNYDPTTRRVAIPRVDNLMAGDIVFCLDMVDPAVEGGAAYEIAGWKTIFYLGDHKFAVLDSDGVLTALEGINELEKLLTFDLFFGLRPSQAYADIYESIGAYTGTFADLTAADMAYQHPAPSQIMLADKYKQMIANMTVADIPSADANLGTYMIASVYNKIGVDVSTNALSGRAWNGLMQIMFSDKKTYTENFNIYHHEYHLRSKSIKGYEAVYNMLMYYDGPAFADMNADGTMNNPLVSMEDLEIGDAIVMGGTGSIQHALIYQGVKGGKHSFLSSTYSPTGSSAYDLGYYKEIKTFADTKELLNYLNGYIVDRNGEVIRGGKYYAGYLVMRPARGFVDINNNVLRDMSDRTLNDYEMELLAGKATATGGTLYVFATELYKNSYVDISAYVNKSVNDMFVSIFPVGGAVDSDTTKASVKMLVNNSWGGTYFADKTGANYQLSIADLQIGDIFCGRYAGENSNVYWNAVYQGNGQFIISKGTEVSIEVYDDTNSIFGAQSWYYYYVLRPDQIVTGATVVPGTPVIPEKTTGRELTEAEKEAIAAVTVWDFYNITDHTVANGYSTNFTTLIAKSNMAGFVNFVYEKAGIKIDNLLGGLTMQSLANKFFDPIPNKASATVLGVSKDAANADYLALLLDESYGGIWLDFAYENDRNLNELPDFVFQIGDVLGVRSTTDNTNSYLTAVYVGNDQFLVNFCCGDTLRWCDVFTKTELLATMYGGTLTRTVYVENQTASDAAAADETVNFTAWNHYYVIRPSNGLAEIEISEVPEEAPGRLLTDAEKEAIAAVTVWDFYNTVDYTITNGFSADFTALDTKSNMAKFINFVYEKAGIKLGDLLGGTTVQGFANNIFEANPAKASANVAGIDTNPEYAAYVELLLDKSYGGLWIDFARNGSKNMYELTNFVFQVGDVLAARSTAGGSNGYLTAIYQGNGNFLVNLACGETYWCDIFTQAELLATMYGGSLTRTVYTENQTGPAAEATTEVVALTEWNHYYVIRPSRGMGESAAPELPEENNGLTAAEKAAIAAVSALDFYNTNDYTIANGFSADFTALANKSNMAKFVNFVYEKAGISLNGMLGELTVQGMANNMFNANPTGKNVNVTAIDSSAEYAQYVALLLENSYGGLWMDLAQDGSKNLYELADFTFQIGDVFAIRSKTSDANCYLTAIYQDSDKFLVNYVCGENIWCDVFTRAELLTTMYGGSLTRTVYAENQTEVAAGAETQQVALTEWCHYYVIRPSIGLQEPANP